MEMTAYENSRVARLSDPTGGIFSVITTAST